MSRIGALWHLHLFYGFIMGIGMGGAFVPLLTTVAKWFDRADIHINPDAAPNQVLRGIKAAEIY